MRIFALSCALFVVGCSPETGPHSVSTTPVPAVKAAETDPPEAIPTEILNQSAALRLLGNSGITLQWIDWEKRGQLKSGKRDGEIWLSGAQFARDGSDGALYLEGRVVEIGSDYFTFSGEITIEDTPDKGRVCKLRRDDWRFAVTQGRKYWRLRQFEWCDGLTDYVDIYF
jgi:hypothetical protein